MEINSKLEEYILNNIDPEDELLYELNRETHLKVLFPRMLSGHWQGNILKMISKMIAPEHILEIGTYTGYSAICLAQGLLPDGKMDTIEIDEELYDIARKYITKAGLSDKINLHTGNALKIIPALAGNYDLIFIDGDKREYPDYYKCAFDKLNPGGFILADNILWNGKVVEPFDGKDEYTKGVLDFNEIVKNDSRVEKVILPLRDGITIISKKPV